MRLALEKNIFWNLYKCIHRHARTPTHKKRKILKVKNIMYLLPALSIAGKGFEICPTF